MNRQLTKFLAVVCSVCITAGCIVRGEGNLFVKDAEAKTLAEIEAEKKEKQDEIQAKKAELESLAQDISQNEKYQQTLQEEIELINSKMLLIDTQLRSVNTEIDEKQVSIDELEVQIAEQQAAVDEGLANFKARIRTLYVHGNDSLLSALVGATDFYDVLAKVDLINRIAKHDDKMCKDLTKQLQELNASQQDLNAQMAALSLKKTEMEALRKEFTDSRTELDSAMAETEYAMDALEHQHIDAQMELGEYEAALSDLNDQADAALQELLREEEKRRQREEEERRRQEEAAEQSRVASSLSEWLRTSTTTTTSTTAATSAAANPVSTAPQQSSSVTTAPTTAPTTVSSSTTSTTAATTPAPVYNGGTMAWPAPGYYYISSPFGSRWGTTHKGIDISGGGIHYANACAAAAGTVTLVRTGCTHDYSGFCGCNGGAGNYVWIDHGNGLRTVYMHLAAVSVSEGQYVSAGTVVGKIGATGNSIGNSGGYHLHFGVTVNGTYVDPMNYLY